MALISLPFTAFSFFTNWCGPASFKSQLAVHMWFFMVTMVMNTSLGGMYITANSAAFSEIFPNKRERVNMANAKGIATGVGLIVGAGFITSLAVSVKDEAGSDYQQNMYLGIACLSMICVSAEIPWCMLMSKSVMTDTTDKSESTLQMLKETWKSGRSVRILSLGLHLHFAMLAIVIPMVIFFLQQCFGFTSKQAAFAQGMIVLAYSCLYIIGFPLAAYLNKRMHPVSAILITGIIGDAIYVVCITFAINMKEQVGISIPLLIAGMGGKGLTNAVWSLSRQVMLAWVIDEDQVVRTRLAQEKEESGGIAPAQVRRDGIFAATTFTAMATAALYTGISQLIMGVVGYESDRDKDNIPQEKIVRDTIFIMCAVIGPLFSVASYTSLWLLFPLYGAKLQLVEQDFAALYRFTAVRQSVRKSVRLSLHNGGQSDSRKSEEQMQKAQMRMSRRMQESSAQESQIAEQEAEKSSERKSQVTKRFSQLSK